MGVRLPLLPPRATGRCRLPPGGAGLRRHLAPLRASGSPGLGYRPIPSGPAHSAPRRRREEAWPSWKGSALLARRRATVRRFESCCLSSLRRRSSGRTAGCYPVDAGSSPAVAALLPRSSSGRGCRSLKSATRVRIPLGALHPLASRSRTRLAMRLGCLPGEAGSIPVESAPRRRSADEHQAPTLDHGGSTPPGEIASQG